MATRLPAAEKVRRREGPNEYEGRTPVSLEDAMRQKTRQLVLPLDSRGEAPRCQRSGEAPTAANGNERPGTDRLVEEVVQRGNAKAALKRVRQNKGSPGVDGMTVDELPEYLVEHWETIREELLAGTYQPKPAKRQEIPKSGGGVRELGIPTALERVRVGESSRGSGSDNPRYETTVTRRASLPGWCGAPQAADPGRSRRLDEARAELRHHRRGAGFSP